MTTERMNDIEKVVDFIAKADANTRNEFLCWLYGRWKKTGNADYYIMIDFCNGLIKGMGASKCTNI